jgi:nucleotide-binding universal stress UspA family protein
VTIVLIPGEQVMAMAVHDVQQTLLGAPAEPGRGAVRRVLVAFDGSPSAWAALRGAIDVAVANRALLTIAAVVDEPSAFWMGFGAMAVPYTRESLSHDLEREMRLHLAEARDEVPATVSVTTQMLHGRPARAIAALAESGGYDLVVTGPRPLGRLGRLVHHSLTHGLLSRTHVSVLAVKPQ